MKNYLVVNKYLKGNSFSSLCEKLKKAFENLGEELVVLTNDIALSYLLKDDENCKNKGLKNDSQKGVVLFFDKDINLCKMIEKLGYRSINSSFAIENCDDKGKTYLELLGKVDMPKTILAPFTFSNIGYTDFDFIYEIEKEINYPIIVKQTKGSFGQQVYLIENRDQLVELVKKLNSSDIIFQEFVKSSVGRDLRVYVVGGKVVAWGKRENKNDFRSNVETGGKMTTFDADKSFLDCAISATKAMKCDFAGVDLLFGENGPLVCEVNSNGLFNALTLVSGVNIASEIAKYYLDIKNNII